MSAMSSAARPGLASAYFHLFLTLKNCYTKTEMDPILPEPIDETGNASPVQGGQPSNAENPPNSMPQQSPQAVPLEPIAQTSLPDPLPQAAPMPLPSQQAAGAQPPASTTPLIADDVDVIEKEWVDRAKKIVSATKADPHIQEKEVSKLQADYLMKRYNKKLKVNE
jgi:hypothetical protein